MNRVLVGEPGVSAFLRSVHRNLGYHIDRIELSNTAPIDYHSRKNLEILKDHIDRIEPSNTAPIDYDSRKNLEILKERLSSFQYLLVDGEARQLGEESMDEWMDDIKHLLYDVEDILDDMKSLNDHQVGVDELYKISDELKNRLGDILARTEVLRYRSEYLKLKRGTGTHISSVVDITEIHSREDDKNNIVKRLLEVDGGKGKKNYDVLCIVGMGGLGKTTLAQLVFNDPEVQKHFNVASWVCVSNVFDVARATKELIENSGGDGGDQQSLAGLQRRLKETVANKKFLFVLDDVWSSNEWEIMKVPFSSCANGSKILVTTRNIKIAHALGNKEPYRLQGLDGKQSMEIFMDKAFADDEEEEEKLVLGKKIVAASGGAPLLVKVIGSMLRGADVEKWRVVSENTASWVNDEIDPAIRLNYYDMSASLKRCFEYLAVFPPDYEFERHDVVRLWIADGLVEDVDGRRAEDIGNEYYNELKARSIIQENNMMQDDVYHLASILSRKFCYKENSMAPFASVRHAFLVNPNATHYEFLAEARCLRTLIVEKAYGNGFQDRLWSLKLGDCEIYGRGLSRGERFLHLLKHMRYLRFLRLGYNSISSLPHSMIGALSQLQILDLRTNWKLKELPNDIGNLRSLRTLDLSWTSISSLPESICALNQMQVLVLGGCEDLKQLPKDIGKLRSLRTLHLSKTSISNLPESICALSQLQVLDLENCECLKELPKDIGSLRSLQKLHLKRTFISSLPDTICALSQLQTLNLEECGSLEELPKDMGNLRSLRKLNLGGISNLSVPESIRNVTGLDITY